MPTKLNKAQSFSIVILGYVIAFIVSYLVLIYSGIENDLYNMAAADFAATVVIFLFSIILRNSSMYDPYWSVYPIFIAIYWFMLVGGAGDPLRNIMVVLLVSFWGIRLTLNWARGWPGMVHEDWRYTKLAQDSGVMYWPVSFLGIHLLPTVFVFFGCIPMYFVFQNPAPFNMIDAIASVITFGAVVIEWVSDNQLRNFKLNRTETSPKVMSTGIWAYSRHPNYFGEIMFWVGLFLFMLNQYTSEYYWVATGAVLMIILFVFISIPMMEKREMRKEGYEEYKSKVSMLIPFPRKK